MKMSVKDFIQLLLEYLPIPGKPSVRYSGLYNLAAREKLNVARKALDPQAVSARQLLQWQD
jgi:hypothetical protein